MKVLWLTNVPSPYRVDFFNELGKYCDLYVLFEKASSSEREEGWISYNFANFQGIILKGISVAADKAISPGVIKVLRGKRFDFVVVTNFATPTGILAIEYMKLHRIPYVIEGDGGFSKGGRGLKERYKRHLLTGAKAYFSTSKSLDGYFLAYGAKKENIVRYPFTSLRAEDICQHVGKLEEKETIRKKHGITGKKVVLTIGRFIYLKGYDILLKAAVRIHSDTEIYIVGGQPTKEYLELVQNLKLSNIHFINFKTKEELKEYFMMADLFVLPTRQDIWGLVINEAMANGLPVVTTDRCVAGLELVEDCWNGFIVPTDNELILADRMNQILDDNDLRASMGENSLRKIGDYTIEAMAARHMEVFKELSI